MSAWYEKMGMSELMVIDVIDFMAFQCGDTQSPDYFDLELLKKMIPLF